MEERKEDHINELLTHSAGAETGGQVHRRCGRAGSPRPRPSRSLRAWAPTTVIDSVVARREGEARESGDICELLTPFPPRIAATRRGSGVVNDLLRRDHPDDDDDGGGGGGGRLDVFSRKKGRGAGSRACRKSRV